MRILDFFHRQIEYNLIFAPHVHLFVQKGGEIKETIPKKYFEADNIYIDLGSTKSVDMVYTRQADIYLGDVSSQAYEFIIKPRPCIFVDVEKIYNPKDLIYKNWRCGEVINNTSQLSKALTHARDLFEKKYKAIQKKATAENIYTEENSTPTQRIAKAIIYELDKLS